MTAGLEMIQRALDSLAVLGETLVVEPEGFPILEAVGIRCPRCVTVDAPDGVTATLLSAFAPTVVVKVASSRLAHRSDVGGVAIVEGRVPEVRAVIADMARRLGHLGPLRFTVNDFVPHHAGPGGELLLGLRDTLEFGPVVSLGLGGVFAEALTNRLESGDDVAVWLADGLERDAVIARLARLPFVRAVTGRWRSQRGHTTLEALAQVVEALAWLGRVASPAPIAECEINPLAVTDSGLVALDVLVHSRPSPALMPAPRPLAKLSKLFAPRELALVGVSDQMNPGHVILRNVLSQGFPREHIHLVRRDAAPVEDCAAVPTISALPSSMDLLVLAVGADQVPSLLLEAIEAQRAESIIVIPGGLEEKVGGASALAPVREALQRARATSWGGPLINGGNCLGVRSLPGRYDTMFIPPYKLAPATGAASPVALIAQSGAFAIAKLTRLDTINPKYVVTVGNQMDLTVGDYLTWLADDPSVHVFGVYVEGFRPHDGAAFFRAAAAIAKSGRTVVLYRAARNPAGAAVSASHTASVAGDYVVTRELAVAAGVCVADSLEDFEDDLRLALALDGRSPIGPGLGAMSNAGFECVAFADNLGPFGLTALSPATVSRLTGLLAGRRLDRLVDIHNPIDLTPMADDELFADAAQALLVDEGVDAAVVGCVPLTPALTTLPASSRHSEDLRRPGGIVSRLADLWRGSRKPWVLVVDSGTQYDAMVQALDRSGLPVFRSADRALRALSRLYRARAPG